MKYDLPLRMERSGVEHGIAGGYQLDALLRGWARSGRGIVPGSIPKNGSLVLDAAAGSGIVTWRVGEEMLEHVRRDRSGSGTVSGTVFGAMPPPLRHRFAPASTSCRFLSSLVCSPDCDAWRDYLPKPRKNMMLRPKVTARDIWPPPCPHGDHDVQR
jgi:hypothetical protein